MNEVEVIDYYTIFLKLSKALITLINILFSKFEKYIFDGL